ncbi:right-handed parallel beta-helix repeat-containing protein [Litoribaculum gwangyangense]
MLLLKKVINLRYVVFLTFLLLQNNLIAKDYYVHPEKGNDSNIGTSKGKAFKTLKTISKINLLPGDRVLLASGQTYKNGLIFINKNGTVNKPIIVTTVVWNDHEIFKPAIIDFQDNLNGILIENSSFFNISHIQLTANGFNKPSKNTEMLCGILINNTQAKLMQNIVIENIIIDNVYYEHFGYERGKDEVKTANGTQKYGWGIRVINLTNHKIDNITIKNCTISNVSHTGIKLTGTNKNISNVDIKENAIKKTGGPGIQMSGVKSVQVRNNLVSHSGSQDDSRKWGRGSGLWTWGSSHVLIEKNKFLYANGPGDSAGAHIDFNCDNIVLQYNLSAYNAGGFCEILGNNYNCSYRYNISINDGHRVKGVDGAFQEGKIFWLSGYQGNKKVRKGPVNSYFYNNTIYVNDSIISKIAIDNSSKGILIANNIFYLEGGAKAVLGDQYKPDELSGDLAENVFFKNNLFIDKNNWPEDIGIIDIEPIIGNPEFTNKGGINIEDYLPTNLTLVKNKGIKIPLLQDDKIGLIPTLQLERDILGNMIKGNPSLGAIEP